MKSRVFALLVHDRPHPLESLREALKGLPVETCSVDSCEEAQRLMSQTEPSIVFTDTSLTDGTWLDVLSLAEKASERPNVIVVGSNKDVKLYISALESGAFDFVLPPFEKSALDFVVRCAADDATRRRQARLSAAVA